MTYCLPQNLLALFAPRDPIPFLAPPFKLPSEKKRDHHGGLAGFIHLFESPEDTPPKPEVETKEAKKLRQALEKKEINDNRIKEYLDAGLYDANDIQDATSDPFKTLFVSRLNYDTSDSKLRREFEYYGPIRMIKMVQDMDGKPRGYAFIEYEHERDMRSAYKHADGKKIDGKRVLVDVERARTVEGWLPRRLGGGLGNTRKSLLPKWKRDLGIEEPPLLEATKALSEEKSRSEKKRRSRSKDRRTEEKEKKRSRSREKKKDRKRSRDRNEEGKEKRKRSKSREKKRKRSRDRVEERNGADDISQNGNDE